MRAFFDRLDVATAAFLDRPLTPGLAGAILVALLLAMDLYIVGAHTWRARRRRVVARLTDLVFGPMTVTAAPKSLPFYAWVPMPEGNYLAKITFRPYDYRRRWWFAHRIVRAHVMMEQPIPLEPVADDAKPARRRLTDDNAVYFVMAPNAPTLAAAAVYMREYALQQRAAFVFLNGARIPGGRADSQPIQAR